MTRLSKARVEPGWVYLAVHPQTIDTHVKVGRSARDPRSNDPHSDSSNSRFRILNFAFRAFGLPPLQVAEAVHVGDMFEVERQMKSIFGCRDDCGSSTEMLIATLEKARAELRRLSKQYPAEV